MNKSKEFEQFDRTMRQLISVPHSEIKAKLDAEKATKARNRAKVPKTRKAEDDKPNQEIY